MTRNPKLKKLKSRLTPEQLAQRTADLEVRSSWRQQMARTLAQNRGAINTLGKGIEMVFKGHRTTRRIVYGVLVVEGLLSVLVAKLMGLF